jgi:hypothetical protein
MQKRLEIDNITEQDVEALLKQNDELCQQKHQPDFPVLELRIDGQSYVFNNLYTVLDVLLTPLVPVSELGD